MMRTVTVVTVTVMIFTVTIKIRVLRGMTRRVMMMVAVSVMMMIRSDIWRGGDAAHILHAKHANQNGESLMGFCSFCAFNFYQENVPPLSSSTLSSMPLIYRPYKLSEDPSNPTFFLNQIRLNHTMSQQD